MFALPDTTAVVLMELIKAVVSLGTLVVFTNFTQVGNDKRFSDNLTANDKRFTETQSANDKRFLDLLLTLRDAKSEERSRVDDKIGILATSLDAIKESKE